MTSIHTVFRLDIRAMANRIVCENTHGRICHQVYCRTEYRVEGRLEHILYPVSYAGEKYFENEESALLNQPSSR